MYETPVGKACPREDRPRKARALRSKPSNFKSQIVDKLNYYGVCPQSATIPFSNGFFVGSKDKKLEIIRCTLQQVKNN